MKLTKKEEKEVIEKKIRKNFKCTNLIAGPLLTLSSHLKSERAIFGWVEMNWIQVQIRDTFHYARSVSCHGP